MADFAFRSYPNDHDPDNTDVLKSRGHAEALRRHLRDAGHDAHVERSASGDEHRVWIQHPEHKDIFTYVTKGEAEQHAKGEYKPYWVRK